MNWQAHPDNTGKWVLYRVEGAEFLLVAWFVDRADAELVCRLLNGGIYRRP